jgi:hypothetical protein
MPTNRKNDEVSQSFTIGTKIEYNGKLYEVIESNQCCDCFLATICSSSDICANDRNDDVLSRDKRINIFGECSSFRRPDSKSVVFMEIPKDDSKDNSKDDYYKISPLYVYNNPTQLRPIELALPKGYVIDKEHSDLDKGIIKFKNKWLSLEQMYNMAKATNYHTYLSEIKDSTDDKSCTVREKLIAIANLMDIASYFNGGWEYDVTEKVVGYSIAYYKFVAEPNYEVYKIDNSVYTYYGSPVFKNKSDAQYVIDNPNFREVLDNIFKV